MLIELQNTILRMVAEDASLEATATRLCVEVENAAPGIVCSILSLDTTGRMHPLASPSLPVAYSKALDGVEIGPDVGSCGTAAFLGVPVAVTDIATDPRWERFKFLPLPLGLLACWSSPIIDNLGSVVGTFAFYYRERREPTQFERDIVEACLPLCKIAFERDRNARALELQAFTDPMTGLANRARFNQELSRNRETGWALLLIDIDNLKEVNDTFGHGAGDDLILHVSRCIAASVAPLTAYRIGGDEFAVIVPAGNPETASPLAERILSELDCAIYDGEQSVVAMATIGGACHLDEHQSPETVRQNADFALYHAKEAGRGGFVLHDEALGSAISGRFQAITTLALALDEDRVVPFYQPIVLLDTEEVVGVEALCRIIGRDGAVIPAAQFHEATKDAHAAASLTRRMVHAIARDIADWLAAGIAFQHVGINVSAADFRTGHLSRLLNDSFGKFGVPLSHAILEVTESVYLSRHDKRIADEIQALRASGLKVALDDFGTGFASLTHLLTVPVDIIKIDKSFVDRIGPDDIGGGIIEGILHIARSLNIRVVSEGVETRAQATALREMGCRLGQGYLYSRAIPKQEMTRMLIEQGQRPTGGGQRRAS